MVILVWIEKGVAEIDAVGLAAQHTGGHGPVIRIKSAGRKDVVFPGGTVQLEDTKVNGVSQESHHYPIDGSLFNVSQWFMKKKCIIQLFGLVIGMEVITLPLSWLLNSIILAFLESVLYTAYMGPSMFSVAYAHASVRLMVSTVAFILVEAVVWIIEAAIVKKAFKQIPVSHALTASLCANAASALAGILLSEYFASMSKAI